MSGWSIKVGGDTIATVSHDDMDRLYEAVVEARSHRGQVKVVCECGTEYRLQPTGFLASCNHLPITKIIRSISHGI